MNSARRGQLACRCATTSSISTIRAGGNAPGNEDVARAAKARPGRVVELEVALDLAVRVPAIGEVQDVMMIEFMDQRRIVDLHELLVAVIIGQRDEQVERSGRREAAKPRGPSPPHRRHRVIHQAGHHVAVERRLEPARTHEQRQFLPHLQVLDRCGTGRSAPAPQMNGCRNHLLQRPARASGESSTSTSAFSSHRSRNALHRQIVAQGARQHGAVDAAGGSAGDDVDDHAQFERCGRSRAAVRNRPPRYRIRARFGSALVGEGRIGAARRDRRWRAARARRAPA